MKTELRDLPFFRAGLHDGLRKSGINPMFTSQVCLVFCLPGFRAWLQVDYCCLAFRSAGPSRILDCCSLRLIPLLAAPNQLFQSKSTMSSTGTFRGTPKGRPQSVFSEAPSSASNIPRPKLESQQSEASTSQSAIRAKQSKRDEVRTAVERCKIIAVGTSVDTAFVGSPNQARKRSQQEACWRQPLSPKSQDPSRHCPCSPPEPGSSNQTQHDRHRSQSVDGRKARGLRLGDR